MNYYVGRILGDPTSGVLVKAGGLDQADEIVRAHFTSTRPELEPGAVVETTLVLAGESKERLRVWPISARPGQLMY